MAEDHSHTHTRLPFRPPDNYFVSDGEGAERRDVELDFRVQLQDRFVFDADRECRVLWPERCRRAFRLPHCAFPAEVRFAAQINFERVVYTLGIAFPSIGRWGTRAGTQAHVPCAVDVPSPDECHPCTTSRRATSVRVAAGLRAAPSAAGALRQRSRQKPRFFAGGKRTSLRAANAAPIKQRREQAVAVQFGCKPPFARAGNFIGHVASAGELFGVPV